jgi:hypothetical protein
MKPDMDNDRRDAMDPTGLGFPRFGGGLVKTLIVDFPLFGGGLVKTLLR